MFVASCGSASRPSGNELGRSSPTQQATHIVSGLQSLHAVHNLVREWLHAGYDIICIHDTWIGARGVRSPLAEQQAAMWFRHATDAHSVLPYTIHCAHNSQCAEHLGVHGVAILILPCGDLGSATIGTVLLLHVLIIIICSTFTKGPAGL